REKELPCAAVAGDGCAGNEHAISYRKRNIAEDRVIQIEITFSAEIAAIVAGFIDRAGSYQLVEDQHIRAQLHLPQARNVQKWKCRCSNTRHDDIGNRRRKGQSGVEQTKAVESVIFGAGKISAESGVGGQSIVIAAGEDDFRADARAAIR